MKNLLTAISIGAALSLGAIACGDDDEDDDKVKVEAPGVQVTAKELKAEPAAGHAGNADNK